ncbi:polysaccharide pyruvyl transferase family protein [uncultured Fusobacterium sp.]|uniref:polysaccharide pyruvyl transferase family protein n=1 Tax=uncultured Fusobacterium sp. TaxID=159267 RepID=UPI0025F6F354|nr:polysaccharide pyruvyl transferase family protein [uncultured Fusobacterium sp.]
MKILHIASFNGNIGDNAHHNGFRKNFSKLIDEEIEWKNLEIRNFYKSWNKMKFDEKFVEESNYYDLIIIGGGNFFEICHEYSCTGTTIDISLELLKQIKSKIFFNALGFDINKGYTQETKDKFKIFLDYLLENPDKYFVTFRNDGSKKNYENLYGDIPKNLHVVPDGGFFLRDLNQEKRKGKNKYLGINLACDMLDKRLKNISYEEFCKKLGEVFLKFIERNKEYKLLFFPHIYSDYKIILDILKVFPDLNIKYNIEIAPYFTGQDSEKEFFNFYEKCDLLTGMRFHTNVCGIALNIPTIGIKTYQKLEDLYLEIGLEERCLDVNQENFFEQYSKELQDTLLRKKEIKEEYIKVKKKLIQDKDKKYILLKEWLSK